ncbi:hypothetical protein CcaCcLH18_00483 [Colletotrichum camelliae]|nr:hypothetical protein CcaCcLH18_00483 [Colletotrichum camelliae]
MKLSKLAFLVIGVTFLSLISAKHIDGEDIQEQPLQPRCFMKLTGSCYLASRLYSGSTVGLPATANITDICAKFRKGLKQFRQHCKVRDYKAWPQYCGPSDSKEYQGLGPRGSKGELVWQFAFTKNFGGDCNIGMVHAAWWEATHNKYGAINCQPFPPGLPVGHDSHFAINNSQNP